MNLTISIEAPLAARLREEAVARSLSPEQVARDILGVALGEIAEEERWRTQNQRRVALIRKDRVGGLTPEEAAELDRLQVALDARLEPVDSQMIAAVEQLLQRAKGLRDGTQP